eukprot:574221-Lingulodinium_polyedra.AAC.1
MDQCMTGAKDEYGDPVKKRTEWTTNSDTLICPMRKYLCKGFRIHGHPTGASLEKLKQYSWKLCGAV